MTATESPVVEHPKGRVWLWVLGLTCFGLFGHAAARRDIAASFAYGIGAYLPYAALFAVVFCVVSKNARKVRWRVFALIYGSLVAGHLLATQAQEQNVRQAAANVKQALSTFTEQAESQENGATTLIAPLSSTSNVEGDLGVAEVVFKSALNDAALLRNDYFKALENVGWNKILDADRLTNDKGMRESQVILAAAESAVEEYRAKTIAVVDSIPARAQQAPFRSESFRREFVKGAESGVEKSRQNAIATWTYERLIIHEFAAIIDLFAKNQGRYEFDEKRQVLFEEQSHADTYNALRKKIGELVQAQEDLAKGAQADIMKKLDSYR